MGMYMYICILYIHIHVCICMYVCMYACMYVYACMCLQGLVTCIHMHVHTYLLYLFSGVVYTHSQPKPSTHQARRCRQMRQLSDFSILSFKFLVRNLAWFVLTWEVVNMYDRFVFSFCWTVLHRRYDERRCVYLCLCLRSKKQAMCCPRRLRLWTCSSDSRIAFYCILLIYVLGTFVLWLVYVYVCLSVCLLYVHTYVGR